VAVNVIGPATHADRDWLREIEEKPSSVGAHGALPQTFAHPMWKTLPVLCAIPFMCQIEGRISNLVVPPLLAIWLQRPVSTTIPGLRFYMTAR